MNNLERIDPIEFWTWDFEGNLGVAMLWAVRKEGKQVELIDKITVERINESWVRKDIKNIAKHTATRRRSNKGGLQ